MKQNYVKPTVVIERYELNTSIAANCGTQITLGPEGPAPGGSPCSEFDNSFEVLFYTVRTSFYQGNQGGCDCYYSAGGQGYFTS